MGVRVTPEELEFIKSLIREELSKQEEIHMAKAESSGVDQLTTLLNSVPHVVTGIFQGVSTGFLGMINGLGGVVGTIIESGTKSVAPQLVNVMTEAVEEQQKKIKDKEESK
ncbi:hypothetical protein [Hazenella coriacea]|uniref:Uncharacterized protein n=1 Tax=Hazenella coriacea TaxID=1179467 RepID=A0A4R3L1W8_9BACL|nr:hypothetical protein [Hazenella coriacea]TCS93152.1 hypothetical protein EDD58_10994 [Hazenella coriacea]